MYYCCVLMKSCRKTMSWHSRRFSQKNSALKKAFSAFVKCGLRQDGPVLDTALRPGPDGDIFYMEKSGGTKIRRSAQGAAAEQTVLRIGKRISFAPGRTKGRERKGKYSTKAYTTRGSEKTHCPGRNACPGTKWAGVTAAQRDRTYRRPVPGSD